MVLACLDLEGVFLPEIWINVAKKTNIKELLLTTRDIADYDKLMQHRLKILKENKIKMNDITDVIATLEPLEGANEFLRKLQDRFQVVILSDTFYEFAMPLMKKMNYPVLFCHNLIIGTDGFIENYKLRINDSKRQSILRFKELNFKTIASGDSYNDLSMIKEAHRGILFYPPDSLKKDYPQYPVAYNYEDLWDEFLKAESEI